jgi:hypothetical protein
MRTGKDKLLRGAGIISLGHPPASTSYKDDEAEDRKKIFTSLRGAAPIFYLENVPNGVAIENDVYCAIITNTSYEERILHELRDEEVPTNIVLMASGNNLQIKGELSVRSLVCYIDSRLKHPEKRNFLRLKTGRSMCSNTAQS